MAKARRDFITAIEETIRRYPHARDAMAFYIGASGFLNAPATKEDIAWAIKVSR
jgi:hypothetical protein